MEEIKICHGCGRQVEKFHSRYEDFGFCAACYKREFKKVQCPECGKGTRVYRGIGPAYCKTCRLKGRTCTGCGKPLPQASKIIGEDAYCWPCVAKRRDPEPCALCGQMSFRLSTSPSQGIDDRICDSCRNRGTHFSCTSCGKYRKPAGLNSKGEVVCKTCLEEENYVCPRCGKKGKRHSKTRCQDCYWTDHARDVIAQGVDVLTRAWTKYGYREFGESLITIYGSQKASHRIPKYLSFFVSLDVRYADSQSITPRNLIKTFGAETLRRNNTAVNFLIRAEIIPAFLRSELKHYSEIQRQETLVDKVQNEWYGRFLSRFYSHALKLQQLSLDRGNKGPSAKTVLSWLESAKEFLKYTKEERGIHALTQIETNHLELFLVKFPGYKPSIRRFIRFLNKEGKLFRPVKLDTILRKNSAHLILDFGIFDRLISRFLKPDASAKEALFGVLMLLYAQTPARISRLKMESIGRNSQGNRTLLFYRVPIELPPEIDQILSRWLQERKALSIHESEHDNPYLFPGRRQGDRISSESISYYYKQWGVTAEQIVASSLFQMYCNGVRHPNAPHNAFGLSKGMTGKYLQMFDAHYHDAMNDFQRKSIRGES